MMQKTKDYSIFKLRPDNRQLVPGHVEKLINSIQSKNLLEMRPLSVNKNMELIDGQHRLKAAEALGVEVYYEIMPDFEVKDLLVLNVTRSWNSLDYLHYFCQHEYPEYLKLKKFLDTVAIPLTVAIDMVGGQTCGRYKKFRNGEYKHPTTDKAEVINTCKQSRDLINRLNGSSSYLSSSRFWNALARLVQDPDFDKEKWFSNLNRLSSKIGPRATYQQYLKNICEIYNWRNGIKIQLSKLQEEID